MATFPCCDDGVDTDADDCGASSEDVDDSGVEDSYDVEESEAASDDSEETP